MQNVLSRTCGAVTRRFAMVAAIAILPSLTACMSAPGGSSGTAGNDRIIVSGASGQLGELVVKELLARGVSAKNLILVSRTPEELDAYKKQGASTRFGDFSKPESLPAAYAGGTRMLLISIGGGAGPRPQAHKRAIDAAVAAGVKHIAYTSYVAISRGDTSGLASDHFQTEEILKNSGAAWTMLRNSIYSNGLIGQAAKMIADGKVSVPANDSRIGYVTREDCAAAAAVVLIGSAHENKAYDITGPELVGPREIARAATDVTGKPIEIVDADPNVPAARRAFGGPSIAVVSNDVALLTGRPATSVRQLFEAHGNELLGARVRADAD